MRAGGRADPVDLQRAIDLDRPPRRAASESIRWAYEIEEGNRLQTPPMAIGTGLTSAVLASGSPLRRWHQRRADRSRRRRPGRAGHRVLARGPDQVRRPRSSAILILESTRAATPSARRTSACSRRSRRAWASRSRTRGCSTRRSGCWPTRTSEPPSSPWSTRSARRLSRQLEFDAIIELVGERVRRLFDVRSIFIALHDPATNLISWPYDLDEGEPFHREPRALGEGLTSTVIRTNRSAPGRDGRGAGRGRRDLDRWHRHALLDGRPDHRREPGDRRPRPREPSRRTRSAMPTSAS